MIDKVILFFGKSARVTCDEKCEKAWGINRRPEILVDPDDDNDYAWLADDELDVAPVDPGTYEGGHAKPITPEQRGNKWCVRECERMKMSSPGELVQLRDFSRRFYNKTPHNRE